MSLFESMAAMLACAAGIFFVGLVAVHFSIDAPVRGSLWRTFWLAVVMGDRDRLDVAPDPSPQADDASKFSTLLPPM